MLFRSYTMEAQQVINTSWSMHHQQMAPMDRISAQLSKDMDEWRRGFNQSRAEFDARMTPSDQGESLDDKIQRMRHETMMDVTTYGRSDGTTVEYDSRADRVFESNPDQTVHFGTEHYHSDYIPDGWHEMKKI